MKTQKETETNVIDTQERKTGEKGNLGKCIININIIKNRTIKIFLGTVQNSIKDYDRNTEVS